MKKSIFALIIFAMLAICFWFPQKTNNSNELVFWTLQLGTFDKYINKMISEFELQNPNIKIKWVDVPYSEGEKRTLAALLSDNPPDLINLTPDFSVMAAQKNALLEIPSSVMSNYPTSLYESLSYNGKFFAIPFYLTSAVTFANTELMSMAGINSIPQTYNEMFSYADKAKNVGKYIEMPAINENDTFLKILNKYNINIYNDFNETKLQNIFEIYKNLFQNNYIPKESITQSHREALEKYMASQVLFLQAGSNFLNIIKENAPDVYEKTKLGYQLTAENHKFDFSMMNLIIPSKAKHKDYALKFAVFITNKENQLELSKLTSVLPANKYALQDDYFKMSDSKEALARKISASQIENASCGLANKRNRKNVILLVNTILAEVVTGKISPDSAVKNLKKMISDFKD